MTLGGSRCAHVFGMNGLDDFRFEGFVAVDPVQFDFVGDGLEVEFTAFDFGFFYVS